MDVLRHARLLALLLLTLQALVVAATTAPRGAVCSCIHGSETPCACPVHLASTSADDARLPPCHRHKLKGQGKATPSDGPCLRADCSAADPELNLVAWLALPSPTAIEQLPIVDGHQAAAATPIDPPHLEPEAPPPRLAR